MIHLTVVEDDDEDLEFLIEAALQIQMIEFTHHRNGIGLLTLLRKRNSKKQTDAIVMDLHLPHQGGYETLIELKSSSDLLHIPVIILTSSIMEEERCELMKKGKTGTAKRAGLDIYSGTNSSSPLGITAFKDKIYFTAENLSLGQELYVYNPTTDVTSLISDLQPGSNGSAPDNFCIYKDKLYFSAITSVLGRELYSYDPVTNATTLIQDLAPTTASSAPYCLRVIDDKLYFIAFTSTYGYELYNYDGIAITRLTDLKPGSGGGLNTGLVLYKNKIYFAGDDGSSGTQLFTYDPSTGKTALNYTFSASGGYPSEFTVYGGKLYFQATDFVNGNEVWETDGTTTKMVQDLFPGSAGSFPYSLTTWKGKLYFSAQTAPYGTELYELSTPEGLGLSDVTFKGSVTIAPNPSFADSRLIMNLDQSIALQISVTDLSGKELYRMSSKDFSSGTHEILIPSSQYPSGIYFYKISDSKGNIQMTGKLCKM